MASERGEEGSAMEMEVNVLLVTETGRGAPMRLAKPASTIPHAFNNNAAKLSGALICTCKSPLRIETLWWTWMCYIQLPYGHMVYGEKTIIPRIGPNCLNSFPELVIFSDLFVPPLPYRIATMTLQSGLNNHFQNWLSIGISATLRSRLGDGRRRRRRWWGPVIERHTFQR